MTSALSRKEQNANASAHSCPTRSDEPEVKIAGAAPIVALNNAFRRSFIGGHVVETDGVLRLPEAKRIAMLLAVRRLNRFDSVNDPHGEHEFGAVEVGGQRFFWKTDAYDRDLRGHSPDPADPAVTMRVLTIMLAEEY